MVASLDRSAPGERALHVLRFLSLCAPAVLGFLIGQTVQELYHTTFAWNLPALRRSVAGQVILAGAIVSIPVVLGFRALGGSTPPIPLAAFALLWFLLGTGVEGSLIQLRQSDFGRVSLIALLAAGVLIDPLFRVVDRYPWAGALSALLLGAACVRWGYGTEAARRRPAVPTLSLVSTFSGAAKSRYRQEVRSYAPGTGVAWTEPLAAAEIPGWVRAESYESYGYRRTGSARVLLGTAIFTVLFVGLFAFQSGIEATGNRSDGLRYALATFLQAPLATAGEHAPPYLLLGWFLGTVAWAYVATSSSLRLQALPYPLSRTDLSRITYRAGLRLVTRFCSVAAFLIAATVLILFLSGYRTGPLDALPGFIRSLALVFALMPLPLVFRTTGITGSCRGRRSNRITFLSVGSVLVTAGLVAATTRWLPAWLGRPGPVVEGALLLALMAASQFGYRRWLRAYFRKADLAC